MQRDIKEGRGAWAAVTLRGKTEKEVRRRGPGGREKPRGWTPRTQKERVASCAIHRTPWAFVKPLPTPALASSEMSRLPLWLLRHYSQCCAHPLARRLTWEHPHGAQSPPGQCELPEGRRSVLLSPPAPRVESMRPTINARWAK